MSEHASASASHSAGSAGSPRSAHVHIEHDLVRAHGLAALAAVLLTAAFGLLVALKFVAPSLLASSAWSTWGRLRYAHTQGVFFGWLGNAFLGFLYYVVPRLTDRPVTSRRLGWTMFWVWQCVILLPGWCLVLAGFSQPLEWAEFPPVIDAVVMVALVLAVVQFVAPFFRTRAGELYVSSWYFVAAIVFTPLAYPLGNLVPEFLPGPMGAAFSGLWTHDAVGLFVTPLALGAAYYVIPATTRRPIFSHALSLVGFWLLVFIYPLNGMHHYLLSPLPMAEQKGAVVASVLLGVNVIVVVTNLLLSLRHSSKSVAENVALRFVWTGILFYVFVSVQGALHALMPFNRVIHFTDWVVGHAHLAMLGFGTFCAIGGLAHAWKHSPLTRYNERALRWAYWLLVSGLLLMFLDLSIAGLVQAQAWSDERPWIESVQRSHPYWIVRAVSGVVLVLGFLSLGAGFLTGQPARQRAHRGAEFQIPVATDPAHEVPKVVGFTYVIVFLTGVVFFGLSFVALGLLPARELTLEIAATTPKGLPPPSDAEVRGRLVYSREGCAYCHTQQVRTTEEDVRRFGAATAAWEARRDIPHLLGTRRVGPDLSREGALRPNDWQLTHLFAPQLIERDSVMPGFPWLFDGSLAKPTAEALDLVAYLQSLGRERKNAGDVPGAAHCSCKEVDPMGPKFGISAAGGDFDRGEQVFASRCAGCHGRDGRGDGPGSAILFPRPANLTVANFTGDRLSDVLWNGVPATAMPKFRELSKEDLKAVIAYVGALGPKVERPSGDMTLGRVVFEVRCAACHGVNGRGDGPSDMKTPRLPANFHDKQPSTSRARDVLAHGIAGTAMVRMDQNLSTDQRDAVVAYLQSLFGAIPKEEVAR